MMIKYPIHKVAKDFKKGGKELPSKEVMDILTQYGHPPKNHMQPLTDEELSIVFEYLTQHNQIDSIESVYADVYHEPAAAKQAAPAAAKPQQAKAAPAQQHSQSAQSRSRPDPQQEASSSLRRPAERSPAAHLPHPRQEGGGHPRRRRR